ncbi:aminopeptidase P family protein [bacterium]|nr:aminopeptidase P family protein [bacterium]
MQSSLTSEKILQAQSLLREAGADCWLTFARETATLPDPALDLILGAHCVWPSAFIIPAEGKVSAIVGSLDVQNIRDHAPFEVTGYVDSIRDPLRAAMERLDPNRILLNTSSADVMADGLTLGMHGLLLEILEGTPYPDRFESSETVLARLRSRKSPAEIESVRSAVDTTLAIFDELTGFLKPGLSEKDVADFILARTAGRGLETAWEPDQCPAVFTGPESAGAHASPTRRFIEPGHLMNIDFGVRRNGYVSDLQRTWYFLKPDETAPPEAVRRGFQVLLESIRRGAESLRPGITGWEVDAAARAHITEAGYMEYPHALGHQVGRKAHDGGGLLAPRWDRYKHLPLLPVEKDQIYTLEPRLTVAGHGVATVEEIVVVTESGCRFLSKPQEELYLIQSS